MNKYMNLQRGAEELCEDQGPVVDLFHGGSFVSLWVLGVEGEALDPCGEVKLTHLFAQAAVGHVGLGGQVHRRSCGNDRNQPD